jgi:hypothetical protein
VAAVQKLELVLVQVQYSEPKLQAAHARLYQ